MSFGSIDEIKRKKLLHSWALCWRDFTSQPIDEIHAYFGTKVSHKLANYRSYFSCVMFRNENKICFSDCSLFCFPGNVHTVVAISSCFWTDVADN